MFTAWIKVLTILLDFLPGYQGQALPAAQPQCAARYLSSWMLQVLWPNAVKNRDDTHTIPNFQNFTVATLTQ